MSSKKSRTILITGCSQGLGRLLAETFASEGFTVYAGLRRSEELKKLLPQWKRTHPTLRPIKLDITSDNDCHSAVEKIIAEQGKIDVLVNNAGYGLSGPTTNFSSADYLNVLNTNSVGAFRLIKEAVPYMRLRKRGRIINITSLNGTVALPNFGIYCSSKFALEALGLSLRYELAKDGIWVTSVAPGAIASKEKFIKNFSHVSAREKFFLIRLLMPLISQNKIVKRVRELIDESRPPARVVLGADAKILTPLQKFLPQKLWDALMFFVWQK